MNPDSQELDLQDPQYGPIILLLNSLDTALAEAIEFLQLWNDMQQAPPTQKTNEQNLQIWTIIDNTHCPNQLLTADAWTDHQTAETHAQQIRKTRNTTPNAIQVIPITINR